MWTIKEANEILEDLWQKKKVPLDYGSTQTIAETGSLLSPISAACKTCQLSTTVPTTKLLHGSAQRLLNLSMDHGKSPLKQEWAASAVILEILWLPVPHKSLCSWLCGFRRPEGTIMVIWSDFLPGTGHNTSRSNFFTKHKNL